MSFIALQVGQCGNQLGFNFFNYVYDIINQKKNSRNCDFLEDSVSRFFSNSEKTDKLFPRALLIDTEPKVIQEITNPEVGRPWYYKNNAQINLQQLGAGNNWAMGHAHGGELKNIALNSLRKQIEKCDYIQGFLLFLSVAGGTGSGFGSCLVESLRDDFPSVSLACISVWPFQKGEVTTQAYNSVMSLASLQKAADVIFIFENDWLLKLCHHKMGLKKSSLFDINRVASQQLANILLPVTESQGIKPVFSDLLAHLVPHSQFKLVGLRSVPQEPLASLPFSAYAWPSLLRSLRRMLLYSTVIDETYGPSSSAKPASKSTPISLSNLLVLRGIDAETVDFEQLHKPSLPYSSWVPNDLRLKTWTHATAFPPYNKTAVLANNGQLSVDCVDVAMAKAWKMFSHKAYFHHYLQNGLTEEDFKIAVMNVEQVISSYKELKS